MCSQALPRHGHDVLGTTVVATRNVLLSHSIGLAAWRAVGFASGRVIGKTASKSSRGKSHQRCLRCGGHCCDLSLGGGLGMEKGSLNQEMIEGIWEGENVLKLESELKKREITTRVRNTSPKRPCRPTA